jgi:hypothetical protein
MGEWGKETPRALIAAAAVSPAVDLALSADALHEPQNRMYEWFFLMGLVRRLRRKAALFPGRFRLDQLKRARSIRLFDEFVTARHFGFAGAADYYTRASASPVIENIVRPTLVVHAVDDPFVVVSADTDFKLRANSAISYVRTQHGGHCAFVAEPDGYDGRWAEQQVINFLDRLPPREAFAAEQT